MDSLRVPLFGGSRAAVVARLLVSAGILLLSACGGGGEEAQQAVAIHSKAAVEGMASPEQAQWSDLVPTSLVAVSAANLPSGEVLLWAADDPFNFGLVGQSYSTTFNPVTGKFTDRFVNSSGHNLFCPGTTNLPDGRLLVNGGSNPGKTSIYDPTTNTWSAGATMQITRGYNANTLLQDGSVFTLGGSFSGGLGNKHGEVWTEAGGWKRLTGVPVDNMVGPDQAGVYRGDNHMWLLPTGNGQVLHAGPSLNMNWIDTRGNGNVTPAGKRGDDTYSMSGNAVMYDVGKILKVGGSPSYQNVNANANSYIIDVNAGLEVRKIAPMAYARAYHTSVVLPNGQVIVIGGQSRPVMFTNTNAVLAPELFDPATEKFTTLPPIAVPRNYHSTALLLPDARVLSAGGGLCGEGCVANQPSLQILSPHYLFKSDGTPATRPVITSAPAQTGYGQTMQVTTDSAVTAFALVRASSTTHTVNNDQRRIPLSFTGTGVNSYTVNVPTNPGWALPGYYMLFALNADGVPAVAKMVLLSQAGTPMITTVGDQSSAVGAAVNLTVQAASPTGAALRHAAVGLPPGLVLNPNTGAITGSPALPGRYAVNLTVGDGSQMVSHEFVWTVADASRPRYVRFEALSEINGLALASMAEFNILDTKGVALPRTGWKVTSDSAETAAESGVAANVIDGNAATVWQTAYTPTPAPMPHWLVVDMGVAQKFSAVRYLPRAGGGDGTVGQFRVYVSADGINWNMPVAAGDLASYGAPSAEKTIPVTLVGGANLAPTIATPTVPTVAQGQSVSLKLRATDPDGDLLTYSTSGLPTGLTLQPSTGIIEGAPGVAGVYAVTVTATDPGGLSASASFSWTVRNAPPTIAPVAAWPGVSNSAVNYTASASGAGPFQYQWNFGDGSATTAFSSSANTSHVYSSPGVYTVTLTVRDGAALSSRSFLQAIGTPPAAGSAAQSSGIALEARAGANTRLWAVNPDNNTVSVFDAVTRAKLAEIAVGTQPQTVARAPDGRLWVVNKSSSSVSIISPGSLSVVQTIALATGAQPYGLVFGNDGSAFVTLEALGRLVRLSAAGTTLGSLDVGPHPRHIARTPDGARLLVSRYVTRPQPGESTAVVQTTRNGVKQGGEVVVVNTGSLSLNRTVVLQHSDKADSTTQGRGVPNYLGAAAVSPDGASAWVPSKQDNILRGSLRDGLPLDFQNTVRAVSSRIALGTLSEDYPARMDHDNAGVASAAVYHPSGAYLFVALENSRQLAVLDVAGRRELLRVDAGRAPQGLVVSADGKTLFVSNYMDRSIGVYDLSRLVNFGEAELPLRATLASAGTEKLAADVLKGKQFFYDARDPRLARDAYLSCASCHNDGGHDGRTWDFTNQGEGLRRTIALRGRAGMGHGFLHWSANFDEVQDFEAQIRGLAGGLGLMADARYNAGTRSQPLGDPKAGQSADLDALASYLRSLDSFAPSPYRENGALTASAQIGKDLFASRNCASCHSGANFTASSDGSGLKNIGTLKASSGTRSGAPLTGIDIPTLRDVWNNTALLHDGSAPTIADAILAHGNAVPGATLSNTELAQLSDYLRQIGSQEDSAPVAALAVKSPGTVSVAVGTGMSLPVTASVPSAGYRFSATGLPAGLTIDPVSGVISGTPTTEGRYEVTVVVGNGDQSVSLNFVIASSPGSAGRGLLAQHYADPDLETAPKLQRVEAVAFNWGTGSPGAKLPADNFGVRWSGMVEAPASGTMQFRTRSDGGVRVWIGNQPVIDNWSPHVAAYDTASVGMVAGRRYPITVEYYDAGGQASMQLEWKAPDASSWTTVPAARLYAQADMGTGLAAQYFDNTALTGTPALQRVETPWFDWKTDPPSPGLASDNFSVRWSGMLEAPATGSMQFRTYSDEGVRVWIGGKLLIDHWENPRTTYDTTAVAMEVGKRYAVRIEYQARIGNATMQFAWRAPGTHAWTAVPKDFLYPETTVGTGLAAEYFDNTTLSGTPMLQRVESPWFDWGDGPAAEGLPANEFSARWSGYVVAPQTGTVRLRTFADDGVRLRIDNSLVIDDWWARGGAHNTASVAMVAGRRYAISLEYRERSGNAALQLEWQLPGAPGFSAVPAESLYPVAAPAGTMVFGYTDRATAFTDLPASDQVLTGVAVRGGWWIDSIQGLATPDHFPKHGGSGGNSASFSIPRGEYLVRIYGKIGLGGGVIAQLSFVTNTGRVFGPYGSARGQGDLAGFDYTVPAGHRVYGFTGRSDDYLYAIGVVHGPR